MAIRFNKNIFEPAACKLLLVVGLLLVPFFSGAQEGEKIIVDTVVESPPPPEEYDDADIATATSKFDKRSDTLSVQQRNIPAAELKHLKEDEDFWYADTDVKNQKEKSVVPENKNGKNGQKGKNEQALNEEEDYEVPAPISQRSWFQTLLWIVILGTFAAVIIMYLSGSNVGLFRKKNIKATDGEEDLITEDIFAINYQKEIDKAAAQGNYRLGIRLMFLRLLKNMSEKNIIRYKQDKTNLDYLMQLHQTGYYHNFFRITRNYEYSWYGQFPVSEDAYKVIRNDFDQFDKELK